MHNRPPYQLLGTHHLELYVGNAYQAAYYYQHAWGFRPIAIKGLHTGERSHVSIVLQQDRTRLVLTGAIEPHHIVAPFVLVHGDAVRDVAFWTDDAEAALASLVRRGAEPETGLRRERDDWGEVVMATVRTRGDVVHTLVQRNDYRGAFLPGFEPLPATEQAAPPVGLKYVDHIVMNVAAGDMHPTVEWYQRVFGFHRFWSADDKDIRTEYSSLASIVVADDSERIRMPINEPAPGLRKSQIEEYLDYNRDPGIQHVAFRTDDIVSTVEALRSRGVEFLEVPDTYYDKLAARVGPIDEPLERLRKHRILVDRDEHGYLLQLFTKPVQDRPTLFYEIIQRKGSESFGKGNFRALFEAIEREQARRGNL